MDDCSSWRSHRATKYIPENFIVVNSSATARDSGTRVADSSSSSQSAPRGTGELAGFRGAPLTDRTDGIGRLSIRLVDIIVMRDMFCSLVYYRTFLLCSWYNSRGRSSNNESRRPKDMALNPLIMSMHNMSSDPISTIDNI